MAKEEKRIIGFIQFADGHYEKADAVSKADNGIDIEMVIDDSMYRYSVPDYGHHLSHISYPLRTFQKYRPTYGDWVVTSDIDQMYLLYPKVCPFCGSMPDAVKSKRYPGDEEVDGYSIMCTNPECVIYKADNTYYRNPIEAVTKWNDRVEVTEK